ncbi:site-specific tyrosine recombinase XerC [compost metagenome]
MLSKRSLRLNAEDLKQAYLGEQKGFDDGEAMGDKMHITLLQIADGFIDEFSEQVEVNNRSAETLKQWRATRKKIVEFARFQFGKQDIAFNEIDSSFCTKLYTYLTLKRGKFLKQEKDKRRTTNLGEAAARKQLKNIKQLINIAVDKSIITKNPCEKFKTSGGEKEVLPLELDEVMKIYSKEMPIDRLEEVRDVYIFQCFTGFAYIDLFNLTEEHLSYVGLEQEPWLIKERGKTSVTEMVPLLPVVLEIIEKYKNHPYCQNTGKLMPINSNSNYNAYLKEIAAICGIKRVLKTHLARHTFADIMLNVCNIPMEDVSKMLGHKSLRTTTRYCRVRKERISTNMKNARNLLFNSDGKLNLSYVA